MIIMEEMLLPEDIAKSLRVSEYKVKDMLRKGTIEGIKVDGQWRIRPAQYKEYLDSLSNQRKSK